MKKFLMIAAALAALIFGTIASAQTQINQANIGSFPYTITKPGSYILTSNLVVTTAAADAIDISASNVTLNLNGFSITGAVNCNQTSCNPTGYGYGVDAWGSNVTIENGSISGFYECVYSRYNNIHDLFISNCGYGIDASYASIRHNIISNIYYWPVNGYMSTVSDNTVIFSNNGIYGYRSTVQNNVANGDGAYGIFINGGTAANNTVMGNTTDLYLVNNAVSTKSNGCTAGAC
jgi:hypothetical protein